MWIFNKIKRVLIKHFTSMSWGTLLAVLMAYVSVSWSVLTLLGEKDLVNLSNFAYWMVVTTSTVGYGDYSPVTPAGKLFVSVFVIPLGLSLFALFVGRVAAFSSFQWRKGIRGLKNLNVENHILVIGWNDQHTLRLIKLLLRETTHYSDHEIVLCTTEDIENPMPDSIKFVKVKNYNNDDEMERACISSAASIIIDTPLDDITMTSALYCYSRNPKAHIIVYFEDESLHDLLKAHCPTVECAPSVTVEMLVKAAVDPGSSRLHQELLNAHEGMTQYSAQTPSNAEPIPVKDLFMVLKEKYEATLIGLKENGNGKIEVNPAFNKIINPGATFFYIADERIEQFDWDALKSSA